MNKMREEARTMFNELNNRRRGQLVFLMKQHPKAFESVLNGERSTDEQIAMIYPILRAEQDAAAEDREYRQTHPGEVFRPRVGSSMESFMDWHRIEMVSDSGYMRYAFLSAPEPLNEHDKQWLEGIQSRLDGKTRYEGSKPCIRCGGTTFLAKPVKLTGLYFEGGSPRCVVCKRSPHTIDVEGFPDNIGDVFQTSPDGFSYHFPDVRKAAAQAEKELEELAIQAHAERYGALPEKAPIYSPSGIYGEWTKGSGGYYGRWWQRGGLVNIGRHGCEE
ncbi:hypothetical protein EF72_21450 [Salmonella enterica]|nr:hypothetical protein [Salmonella enterica]